MTGKDISAPQELTAKDNRDIAKDLDSIMENLPLVKMDLQATTVRN